MHLYSFSCMKFKYTCKKKNIIKCDFSDENNLSYHENHLCIDIFYMAINLIFSILEILLNI